MRIRICVWTRRFYSSLAISKSNMNKNKCYFRFGHEDEKVDISFLLQIRDTTRQFNFCRSSSEDLVSLASRISTNVQKVMAKNNKKKTAVPQAPVAIGFLDNNVEVSGTRTCKNLFDLQGPLSLKVDENEFEIILNSPWVLSISLPVSILAGFAVYPEHFKMQHADVGNSIFKWYRGSLKNEKGNTISEAHVKWEFICESFSYTPSVKDIGMNLKLECIPGNEKTFGPATDTVSKNCVEAGPGKCPFEIRHMFTTNSLSGKSFRCVSYNILADLYCDSEHSRTVLHPFCPPYALNIDYRKQLVLKELLGYNADIICLQEMDKKIFQHWLSPLFENCGIKGQFYKKGKEVAEGLACFYRSDRLRFLEEETILFSEAIKTQPSLQSIWDKIKHNGPLLERLLDRSTIGSVTFLESIENPNEIFMIGNTHLYFHPDADHIRLLQAGMFIYWIMDINKTVKEKYPDKRISIILCGDYNSVPSCGIFKLYTTGVAPSTLPDWSSNSKEAVEGVSLSQDIPLGSACGTPSYTNFTADFKDCLDYIYYSTNSLEVEQVIPFPSYEELANNIAIPSVVFPSDHVALVADLHFK